MKLAALPALLPGIAPPTRKYFRMVGAAHAADIDETAHTVLYSWRYNPKGEFAVLSLSSTPECAYREKLKQVGEDPRSLKPQVVATFTLRLARCLDLTDAATRRRLGVSLSQLVGPTDFTVIQALAREARKLGFEAIMAPSAIGDDCHSLVVFKDRLAPPSCCLLVKDSVSPYPR